jgi:glycosyltransferase involved in cell wall biosynthesis
MEHRKNTAILFVSTNPIWGGSEVLWSKAALQMLESGYSVAFAVKYKSTIVETLTKSGGMYFPLQNRKSIVKRMLVKLGWSNNVRDSFHRIVSSGKYSLIVISQGNNVDGGYYMQACQELAQPYITVTQLVTEFLWTFLNDKKINGLIGAYAGAVKNYFVSQDNLNLHIKMFGEQSSNSKVISNPFAVDNKIIFEYPDVSDGVYHVATVARLETYHKGYDLLLEVISSDKWKSRPIVFHFYGEGPHKELLERLVRLYGIANVVFEGHVQDVTRLWQSMQLMVLPSRMEGQSVALLEAMWCFRAAVVTDLGGARELITDGENGFIAAYPSVAALDEALERAWEQRDSWATLGKKAGTKIRKVYSEHPVNKFCQEIESLIPYRVNKH